MKYQRIQDLRIDSDLSQKQLGEILHISQRSYSHYETGSRGIPVEMLIRLADYYDTTIEQITKNRSSHSKQPNNESAVKNTRLTYTSFLYVKRVLFLSLLMKRSQQHARHLIPLTGFSFFPLCDLGNICHLIFIKDRILLCIKSIRIYGSLIPGLTVEII